MSQCSALRLCFTRATKMIIKTLLLFLFIAGTLAGDSKEKFESRESKEEFYSKQKHHEKEKFHGKKHDAAQQLEKDYGRWSDKQYIKQASGEPKGAANVMTINEIDDNIYIDKYNKNGYAFNTKLKKSKSPYHEKKAFVEEKHSEEHEKPRTLFRDTDVNFIDANKKKAEDSELINGNNVEVFKTKENYQENFQNANEKYMKREKKNFYQNLRKIDLSNPPPANDTVMMARYIVHSVDWAALGTLSGRPSTKGAPFVCVKATSDGSENASSGIPFFYMSPRDLCTQDLQKDNRVSIVVTLSETEYCKKQNLDPQDPRCAKLTLSGKIKKIKAGSEEEKFAKNALFTRHPQMESWPSDHNWYFTKLKIGQIILLDKFGGATFIKVKDYLNGGVPEPMI